MSETTPTAATNVAAEVEIPTHVYSTEASLAIANTIADQLSQAPLGRGAGRLRAMVGARNLTSVDGGLRFNFSGCHGRKWNGVEIRLNGRDLYDVTFYMVTRRTGRMEEHQDIHVESLIDLFRSETGLETYL